MSADGEESRRESADEGKEFFGFVKVENDIRILRHIVLHLMELIGIESTNMARLPRYCVVLLSNEIKSILQIFLTEHVVSSNTFMVINSFQVLTPKFSAAVEEITRLVQPESKRATRR